MRVLPLVFFAPLVACAPPDCIVRGLAIHGASESLSCETVEAHLVDLERVFAFALPYVDVSASIDGISVSIQDGKVLALDGAGIKRVEGVTSHVPCCHVDMHDAISWQASVLAHEIIHVHDARFAVRAGRCALAGEADVVLGGVYFRTRWEDETGAHCGWDSRGVWHALALAENPLAVERVPPRGTTMEIRPVQ